MTIDVIELSAGTYHFSVTYVNVDRTARPLTVRPVSGAAVTFNGDVAGGGQFYFGLGGVAKYITFSFTGVTFTNYTIGDTGVVWMGNVDHITFNGPTVQNIVSNGSGSIYSWALYLSIDAGVSPTNVTANNWNVQGTNKNISALQVGHPPSVMSNITTNGWTVNNVAISIYAYSTVGNYLVDGWTITNSIRPDRPYTVFFGTSVTGVYSNMHFTNSGLALESQGGMTNGGGNTFN